MRKLSIKPVFGQTRLERRFRLLYLASISVIIFAAWWQVDRVLDDSVVVATVRHARKLAESGLLRYHWEAWEEDAPPRELSTEFGRTLETEQYQWNVLALDDSPSTNKPANADEERIVRELEAQLQQQSQVDGIGTQEVLQARLPLYYYRPVASSGQIHYYQAVYWKSSCVRCHGGVRKAGPGSLEKPSTSRPVGSTPFRVLKVIIPDRETRQAVTRYRALLTAVGIVTVFVAMVASCGIFRFLVIRPLRRLREARDEMKTRNAETNVEGGISADRGVAGSGDAVESVVRYLTEP